MPFVTFLFWVGFSAALATAANTRGRSAVGWFILAFFITPLLAACFLFALPVKARTQPTDPLDTPEFRERVNRWNTP